MDIAKSKLQRQMYLRRLHEKGCDELHPCRILEVGRELGWDDPTTDEIENFLEAEGLVRFPAFGEVCITHPGQLEVERVIFESNQSSEQLVSGTPPSMMDNISKRETTPANTQARSKAVPILLFVLGIIVAIVSNVASSILPREVAPYLWLSWPLLAVLVVISILLLLRQ